MRATTARELASRLMAVALCAALLLGTSSASFATPSEKIQATRAEAARVRAHLDDLAADLEERSEEYLAVQDELAETRERIRIATDELAVARVEVGEAETQLNGRVNAIYRGGDVNVLAVFVGVTDFRDLVSRLELLGRIGRSDAAIVARVKDARARTERTKRALENRRVEQIALLRRAGEKKAEVRQALDAQKAYLARVDRTLARLIAEERERKERIARERAQAAAAAAARSAARSPVARTSNATALPAPHPQALAVARRFIGKTPYVWGGTTPAGFDCSGLTQYCYREIGVSIPRTSRQQYKVGAFISPDRLDLLAPGDLVFFGRGGDPGRVHHVGIYSGSGRFVHAPQTGMDVSESSLLARIAERGDYVGAVRP